MPGVKPVVIELTDVKTKEKVEELEVDACLVATGRAPYTHVSNAVDLSPASHYAPPPMPFPLPAA